jgi:quinol monooxygenase YgiN
MTKSPGGVRPPYAGPVIVICRFRVQAAETVRFAEQARIAIQVLAGKPGHLSADLGRNLDDEELWTLTTRWQNVGSYRRALQGFEAKTAVVPLLSSCLDEPTAYEDPEA